MRERYDDSDVEEKSGWRGRLSSLRTRAASLCGNRPLDLAAGVVAVALASGTVANALFLQNGPHPSPLMVASLEPAPAPVKEGAPRETTGSVVSTAPVPRAATEPAPVAARSEPAPKRTSAQLITELQRELARRGYYDGTTDGLPGPRLDAAIRKFEQSAGMKPSGKSTEALLAAVKRTAAKQAAKPAPVAAQRVTAVQRALTEFGYGQLKPNGTVDAATRKAIEKFERERKLPVKGEVSARLLRELAAATGRTL